MKEYTELWQRQRVGIMANQTACDRQGRFIVEVFQGLDDVEVTALFAPEHGLWGTENAGAEVETVTHPQYGIPVYSLYGPDEQAQPPVLDNVDVLVFDMQDIGARFYTYVSSMALAMQAVARAGKTFVVLDRPNPLNGHRVEGPVLDIQFQSFKGYFPIPVIHGMTVGELARFINRDVWMKGAQVNLKVISMQGWTRDMSYEQTGLRFIRPSPNIPDLDTALVYPGIALIEGTNVSEGRGTSRPFRQLGAPWITGSELAKRFNALELTGVYFTETSFTPISSKYAGELCHGVALEVTDPGIFKPFQCGAYVLQSLHELYPEKLRWRLPHLDELVGTDAFRRAIETGEDIAPLLKQWERDCTTFREQVSSFLLYE